MKETFRTFLIVVITVMTFFLLFTLASLLLQDSFLKFMSGIASWIICYNFANYLDKVSS